jgi:transposase, IS6 family
MFLPAIGDLELMLPDCGVEVAHTTISRWIQAFVPEIEKRIRAHLRPTYIKVKNSWTSLYRAVDFPLSI